MTETADPSSTLAGIRERIALVIAADLNADAFGGGPYAAAVRLSREDTPLLVAALDAALALADDLTRKSEALDAEAEYIAGEHPEAAAVAVLKRERSIAYDECARWFREAITSALTGEGT